MKSIFTVILMMPLWVMAESSCPSTFPEFLQKFESDRVFQQENISYPLKYSFLDYQAQPEPKQLNRRLSKSEIASRKTAIFLPPAIQKSDGLEKKISDQSATKKTVLLQKPDTGYVLTYHFEKIKGCWKLAVYENFSM